MFLSFEREMAGAMEVELESQRDRHQPYQQEQHHMSKTLRRSLLILNFAAMVIGNTAGPLVLRVYFLHGGNRKWLSSCLQTAGCPLLLVPLLISYFYRRRHQTTPPAKLCLTTPRLFLACAALGLLVGLDDFFYSCGISYLPVSTSSILISTQLGFTAAFAFLIVRQRFTAFSVNAVVLLTFGAAVLGMLASGDRPAGESKRQYDAGFFMTLCAAGLYGLILPLVELTYSKTKQKVTYTLVLEMQLVMGFFATVFSIVGMVISKDFQAIPKEGEEFRLGEANYYILLICSALLMQFFFIGTVGAIFYASALLAGVIMAMLIPVTELLAVVFLHEKFSGGKGVALALSLWGFASYFYGELLFKNPIPEG